MTRFRPPIFWLKRLYLGPTGINRIKLFRKLFCFCKDIRLQRSKIMCHVDVHIVNLGCPRGQRLRWHSHTGRNNSEFQVKSTVNYSAKFQTLYKTAVIWWFLSMKIDCPYCSHTCGACLLVGRGRGRGCCMILWNNNRGCWCCWCWQSWAKPVPLSLFHVLIVSDSRSEIVGIIDFLLDYLTN